MPFRYRGYYDDKELNLYYLKTIYYDSNLGSFISTDMISYVNPESVMGYNLYAYCNNNPVMYSDGIGHSPEWWQWLLSGAVVIAGIELSATGVGGILSGVESRQHSINEIARAYKYTI